MAGRYVSGEGNLEFNGSPVIVRSFADIIRSFYLKSQMTFSNEDKFKALAIVNVFETSRPFGDYAACVVLNDGAGVSYGINQFTHRSGSLAAVVRKYLAAGGQVERENLTASLPTLNKTSKAAIAKLASDATFKAALRAAAITNEMRDAQNATAFDLYLRPALDICEKRGFTLPLSLAVVYDSVTHGSWNRIAAKVARKEEKAWVTDYVRARHAWLTRTPRLKATNYRTKFFLDQIATGNWHLLLPLRVHGVLLSEPPAVAGGLTQATTDAAPSTPSDPAMSTSDLQPPATAGGTDKSTFQSAADTFDRLDGVVSGVMTRSDRAKSLWTTVGGTLWQAAWAVFGFFAGLPREVWIVVAIIAGLLMLLFLYRQIALGRIREEGDGTRIKRIGRKRPDKSHLSDPVFSVSSARSAFYQGERTNQL